MGENYTMSNVSKTNPEFKDLYLFHGKSAYQAAVEQGFVGTEQEWIESLKDIVFGNIASFDQNNPYHIYIDIKSDYIYRYDVETGKYKPIGGVLGETAETAYRGDRGKIAYDHSQSEHVALDHHHQPEEIDGLMDFINTSIIGEGDAPENLNTISKIAAALGDDPNFATTVSTNISTALTNAKKYADAMSVSTLRSAKSYSDNNLISAKEYADQAEADALKAAKSYTDETKNALLGSAPTNLDTLDKLAAAIGDDPNFATTVRNTYLPLSGGNLTGNVSLKEGCNILLRPNAASYTAGIGYDTLGNECIALWAESTVTRLRWHAGTDMSSLSAGKMMDITPDFEVSKASGTAKGYIAGKEISVSDHTHSYIETKGNFKFNSATLPNSFDLGLSIGFVNNDSGFGGYGSVITGRSYSGGGGTLQLYAPYAPNHGGTHLKARFGNYTVNDGNSWTDLKELAWLNEVLQLSGGTLTGALNGTSATFSGNVTAAKVYNAVWNDYAEWFEREDKDEEIHAGDICVWNNNGIIKSDKNHKNVVGVYSDTYGQILGGKKLTNMEDNIKYFIPIGLSGRVKVKVIGKVNPGDYIIPSDIPGVGKAFTKKKYEFWKKLDRRMIVGKALESKSSNEIDRITILISAN